MTSYYPIMIDLERLHTVVVGGGSIAARKVLSMIQAGSTNITIIAPTVTNSLSELIKQYQLIWLKQTYDTWMMEQINSNLIVAATDDASINREISAQALSCGILVCNVSNGSEGNFITPAVARGHNIVLTASTLGGSPALAKAIREHLEREFIIKYDHASERMSELRLKLKVKLEQMLISKEQYHTLMTLAIDDVLNNEQITKSSIDDWIESLQYKSLANNQ